MVPDLNFRVLHVAAIVFILCLVSSEQTRAQTAPSLDTIVSELREHRAAKALEDADAALRTASADPRLWTLKGMAQRDLGNTELAATAFSSALRIAPAYLPALEGAAEVAYSRDPGDARRYVDRVLQQAPEDHTANAMAAMLDYRTGNWAAAAEHFSRSGADAATQYDQLSAWADTLARLNRDSDAAVLFRKLIEHWPDDVQARYNLAVLQLRVKAAHDAVETLQPLIARREPNALSLAASAYETLGDTPRAVDLLTQAIRQDPREPQHYLDFAAISFDHASFNAGIAMINAGLTQLPNSAPLWIARGVLYMQNAQVDLAEADFERANRLDRSQSFGVEAQGLSEIQRHDLPAALRKVRESLSTNPQSAYLHYLAAEIVKEEGATPQSAEARAAIADASKAVDLDPNLTAARDLLSALALQAGDVKTAAAQCRLALQKDPSDQQAMYRLILILRRGGQQKDIAELVEKLRTMRTEGTARQAQLDRYHLVEMAPPPAH